MFKSNGGFTLVELIVVIAILGILAVVAVPQYSQYVSRAESAVNNYTGVENQRFEAIDAIAQEHLPATP